jgi:hypothetical protein
MNRLLNCVALATLWLLLVAAPVGATTVTYTLVMDGLQEVPGPGDGDGSAIGTITLNDATGEISWNLVYADIDFPVAMHIHPGAAGAANPPLVDLGIATSGGAGTLISSVTTSTTNVANILADPTAFYVNLHTEEFIGGAVRDQLGTVPEPGVALLLGVAAGVWWVQRR